MKARVWKDRDTGQWCYEVHGHGLRFAGDRATWGGALSEALADMRRIETNRATWRQP